MSKPIALHADGSDCYTKGCSRQGGHTPAQPSSTTATVTREEFLSNLTNAPVNPSRVALEAQAALVSQELDDAYYRSYEQYMGFAEDAQEAANEMASDPANHEFVKARIADARERLALETESLKRWVMDSDSKDEKLMRRKAEVGVYLRAIALQEDKANPIPDRYHVFHDNGIGGGENLDYASDINSAISLSQKMYATGGGYDDTIETHVTRINLDGSKTALLRNHQENLVMNIAENPVYNEADEGYFAEHAPIAVIT